jgi:hypothetical protein
LARHLEGGAAKYGENNYQKGMAVSRCIDSAFRHLICYMDGQNEEDHLAGVLCNIMFILYYEKYMPEMMDLPKRMYLYDEK